MGVPNKHEYQQPAFTDAHKKGEEIKAHIKLIVSRNPEINCFSLYLMIRRLYPAAIAWYNNDHVITQIDGSMYDRRGCIMYDFAKLEPEQYAKASKAKTLQSQEK